MLKPYTRSSELPQYDLYIVELTAGGHRTTFLRYLVEHAVSKELSVCIATLQSTIDSQSFCEFEVPLEPLVLPDYLSWIPRIGTSSFVNQLRVYFGVRRFLSSVNPKRGIVFPTLQATGAIPLGLFGSGYCHSWSGVLMAPAAHLRNYSIDSHHSKLELAIQKFAYMRMIRDNKCMRLSSFDVLFSDWMGSSKVVSCPDPVELKSNYELIGKEFLDLEITNKVLVVVAGTIDKRKKIPRLARAILSLDSESFHLLVVGSVKDLNQIESEEFKKLLITNKATVITRRLSDTEIDFSFSIADVLWSGNDRTYGSSGAVVRGGAHGKPVITMYGSVMSEMMRAAGGGPIIDMTSETEITAVLKMLESEDVRKKYGESNKSIFGDNTTQKYAATVLAPLLDHV